MNRMKKVFKVTVDELRCKGCSLCVTSCPAGKLELSEKYNKKGLHYVRVVERNKCSGCGFCYLMCPDVAIAVYEENVIEGKKDE